MKYPDVFEKWLLHGWDSLNWQEQQALIAGPRRPWSPDVSS